MEEARPLSGLSLSLDLPANDNCDAAEMITVDSVFTKSLKDATASIDEEEFSCFELIGPSTSGCCEPYHHITGGIWYSFVGTGEYRGSNEVKIIVSIYSGPCGQLKCEAGVNLSPWGPMSCDADGRYPTSLSIQCSRYNYGHRSGLVETVVG